MQIIAFLALHKRAIVKWVLGPEQSEHVERIQDITALTYV